MPNTNIISAQLGGKKIVTHTWANDVLIVAGNNTVSNLTSNSTEVVVSATITGVKFGSQAGTWVVTRSNSSVNTIVGVFNNSGYVPLHDSPITIEPTKNIKLELVGTANGFIMLELHKASTF